MVLEKQLVSFLNALTNILYCLRADQFPEGVTLPQSGDMSLKFCTIQMLTPHPVVPFVQRNTVVVDDPSSVN